MSLRQTKFGINDLQEFTKIALKFLECRSLEELSKVKDEGNALAEAIAELIKSKQYPINATLINISNFLVMLYRMKSHTLGNTLSADEIAQVKKIMQDLFSLMEKPEDKTSEYGAIIYMINSYLSLAECAVSCVLQDALLLSDEAIVVRANTFICGCVYDQVETASYADAPRTITPFNYREFNKGFDVISSDTLPTSVCEKLIYALNKIIVESMLKIRYRLRTSYHALARVNGVLTQLNLCEFAQVRAMLTTDQALFSPSPDILETNQLQSYYAPTACGLIGRIDNASKAEALLAYIVKSHQLILKLLQIALIDRIEDRLESAKLVGLIKDMSNNTMIDLQLLCSVMNRYHNLSYTEQEVRILERDLLFIITDITDRTKEIGFDYENQVTCAYRVTNSGYHIDLRPTYLRFTSSAKDKDDIAGKVIAEITDLIKKYETWTEQDGSLEAKASFARMIKDYFYAALSTSQSKSESKRLREELLYSFTIDKLKVKDGCDHLYELLILVNESSMSTDKTYMELYLEKISTAVKHLETASKYMSIINFARFMVYAKRVTQTILHDIDKQLGHLKQAALSYATTLDKFRKELDDEVKAIISAIESPKKKYNPAAAITGAQDTTVSVTDYLDVAVMVMRAENETELSLLSTRIAALPDHPLIILDSDYASSQLAFNRCLLLLPDMLEILLFSRRLTLRLPVTDALHTKVKQKLSALRLTAQAHDDDMLPSSALKIYFSLTTHLADILITSNSIESAKYATDYLLELRNDANQLIRASWTKTKTYPDSLASQMVNSFQLLFTQSEPGNSYERFIVALQSLLANALSAARTKAYKACALAKNALTAGSKQKSSVRQYHALFISVNLLDNVIKRLPGIQTTHTTQTEDTDIALKEVCDTPQSNLPSLVRAAKMPSGSIVAVNDGDNRNKVTSTIKALTKLAGVYDRLYRSCVRTDKKGMKDKPESVLFNTLLYNEYLGRQLAFLASDLQLKSASQFQRELDIIQTLQLGIQAFHYGIDGEFPTETMNKLLEFDCDSIIFDDYFAKDLNKITSHILNKRLDYYSSRLDEYIANKFEIMIYHEINHFIERHKSTSGDARKQAARFIMEYYLRFVFISAKTKQTERVSSLHDKVFEICAKDELLPAYMFINYGYKRLSGIDAPLNKQDTDELYSQLAKISGTNIKTIDEILNGLSPILYVYLSQLAQHVTTAIILRDKNPLITEKIGGLALQQFRNSQSDKQFLQEFQDTVSAINPVDHLPLPAVLEAYYLGKRVSVDDYLVLGAEILEMQDAAQAALLFAKLEQIPERPFIQLEGELASHQERYNHVTSQLHGMLVMLHIARRQSLKLTVSEEGLAYKQQMMTELLGIASYRDDEPVIIQPINFLLLQAARVAQYFGMPEHQIDITSINCVTSLPQTLRQVESAGTDEARLASISYQANYHTLMHKLSAFMQAKLDLIHQSLLKRMSIAQQMLAKAMTDEQRARIPDYSTHLSLLNTVIAQFKPGQQPEINAAPAAVMVEVTNAKPAADEQKQVEAVLTEPAQTEQVQTVLTPAPSITTEIPKVGIADVMFAAVCVRCYDEDADKYFEAIYTFCQDIINSKKHSSAVRVTAATTLSLALMHKIDTATNIEKRRAVVKMLSTYQGFIARHDKQNATSFEHNLKQFEQYIDKLTKKANAPKKISVATTMEIETFEVRVEPACEITVDNNSSALVEETQSNSLDEQPNINTTPIVSEILDFTKEKFTQADLEFETVCKNCHDDDADVCFNNIAKYCLDTLQSKRRSAPMRVKAALTLAQALMYREHESSDLSKREQTHRLLISYQTFIKKNAGKSGKQFVKHLDAYQNRKAQRAQSVKTKAVKATVTSEASKTTTTVTNKVAVTVAAAPAPKVMRILKRTPPITSPDTSVTVAPPTQPAAEKKEVASIQNAGNMAEQREQESYVKAEMQQSNPSITPTATSTASVLQRLVHSEPEDNSLIGLTVPRTNRLLYLFQMQLSYLQQIVLSAFTSINQNVFIYGNSVLSSLYHAAPGHLQFACRLPKDYVFTLLTHDKCQRSLCIKEVIECHDQSGFLLRLDESKLRSAKLPFSRSDLLIEVKCLTGANDKAALEQFCHQQRLTSTMFYYYNKRCLIDVANHARCTAVYPVMRMDQRHNIMAELDLTLIDPSLPPSKRDNREVILDALLQLSSHHMFLGCGMALKCFVTLYKHELRDIKKKALPIEWFDELFLNDNAMDTLSWLTNFDMLYDLFPQLHTDYANDFKIACEELCKATSKKNYRLMTHDEIISLRASFLLNAFYRSFRETIIIIDFLQESGLDAFMQTFCKFANGLLFEWLPTENANKPDDRLDLLEATTQRFWNLLLQDAIPGIYHEFFRCHPDKTYEAADKDKFIQDLITSLAEDGYPNRSWLAEQVWQYHEQSFSHPGLRA